MRPLIEIPEINPRIKTCRTCNLELTIKEFPKNGKYRRKICKMCFNLSRRKIK